MANEFIIKNGFFSQGSSNITGSLALSGAVSTVGQGYFNQGVWSMVYANLFGAEVFRVTYTTNNFLLGTTTDSGYRLNVNGSSGFNGNATITGSLIVTGNLNVIGTSSFTYTTASIVQVGSNIITLNTNNPATRFGGITVVDSGSFGTSSTGSLFWDSLNNKWIYSNPSGSSYSGGMLISGPRNTSSLGDEQGTLDNYITKGQGGDHITSSMMYEDSSNNIGIGTITPRTKFDVYGGDATIRTAFIGTVAAFGDSYTTFSHLNRTGSRNYSFLSDKDGLTYVNAEAGSSINLRIDNIDKVNIDASGNLGIGTTTPNTTLDVNGNAIITGSLFVTSGVTGSLLGTASYADQALSASYAPPTFPYTGSATISGSLRVTGTVIGGFNPRPVTGSIKDGVTSILGNLQDWNGKHYSGEVLYSEASNEALEFGQLCYRDRFGLWGKAIGDVAGEPAYNMLGICLLRTTAGDEPTSILTRGYVETTYTNGGNGGRPLYMKDTAGSITYVAPSAAGNVVRVIGHVFWNAANQTNSVTIIHFNPDNTWIEL